LIRAIAFPTHKLFVGVMAREPESPASLEHKYTVGQIVELTPTLLRAAALGEYEIRQIMPAPDINSASPRYRIKSAAEIHDRIVAESELTLRASEEVPATACHTFIDTGEPR
jgi:hypothetical protein